MWQIHEGWGWWMAFGWVWMVMFWGLIIWVVYAFINRSSQDDHREHKDGPDAFETLERRYARGEINVEEFDKMRRTLKPPGSKAA